MVSIYLLVQCRQDIGQIKIIIVQQYLTLLTSQQYYQ